MKTVLALSLLFLSHSAWASDFDQNCLNRYRNATLSLIDSAQAFNHQESNSVQFLAEYSMIEAGIGASRLACAFEPAEIKECISRYKKQYHKISDRIDMVEIANGNQTHVSTGLVEAAVVMIDVMCQQN